MLNIMSPQRFVKSLPVGWREISPLEDFVGLVSTAHGFQVLYKPYFTSDFTARKLYAPEDKIAVRMPDGRLVIPTVKGEKSG